jgi:UDP-N-acetylmuramyl pentapeptide phosphotransferase/UDP-N-acetylglucosamine-1-phosphate transferase
LKLNKILILIVSLFILSLIITFLIRKFALRYKILDIPNERSSHNVPTPRGGGLAIVITWYIGITVLFFWNQIDKNLYFAILCGSILAIISLLDDLITIKPLIRLVIQAITAVIAFVFLGGINSIIVGGIEINLPMIIYPIAIIGIVWFINLFNFLDGTDGYASLEAITISAFMFFFAGSTINLIIIACIAGFLFWNWPKAKIFMGDIGSTQLGFILVILGIYFHNTSYFSIIHWSMLSSLFWFDATLTLFRRWRNKEKLSVAHKKHAFQRAVQSGLSHKSVLLFSFGINVILGGLVYLAKEYEFLLIPLLILNILLLFIITRYIDSLMPFNSTKMENK